MGKKETEERSENEVAGNNGGGGGGDEINGGHTEGQGIPPMALNHVSRLCKSVEKSADFYTKVLGFIPMERPGAFDFNGAWLFNYGVGVHLVQAPDTDLLPKVHRLDPLDNHISFQCEDAEAIEQKLKEMNIKYVKRIVETSSDDEEGRSDIDQLFFNDPDGFMIEICNCENLKLVPSESPERIMLPPGRHNPPVEIGSSSDVNRLDRQN